MFDTLDSVNRILVEPDETARRIRKYARKNPGLRKNEYDGRDGTVEGMCYLPAEAYYHAKGARDSGLRIYCLSWADVREDGAGTHWYLRDGESGPWVDLGLEQPSEGTHIPYSAGRHRAFMTGYEPSNRAKGVLEELGLSS